MKTLATFDYEAFRVHLLAAAREAFASLQKNYPEETFYIYALYLTPMRSHLFASANSEAALARAAQRHGLQDVGRGWYADLTLDDVSDLMRDIPTEWEYHCFSAGMVAFDAVSDAFGAGARWYEQVAHRDRALPEDTAWAALQAYLAQMRLLCADVLQTLDSEGVFGSGTARERCTLTLLMSDSTQDERAEWADKLNAPTVAARYRAGLERASMLGGIVTETMRRGLYG